MALPAQDFLYLRGHSSCLLDGPARVNPGMADGYFVLFIQMYQGSFAKPGEQLIGIGGLKNSFQRIALTLLTYPCGYAQQVKIVVAEHTGNRVL